MDINLRVTVPAWDDLMTIYAASVRATSPCKTSYMAQGVRNDQQAT
jgi:hypothetical protein